MGFVKSMLALSLGLSAMGVMPAPACTRVMYKGLDSIVLTARSMDWKENIGTDLWIFPRGMRRNGEAGEHSLEWRSKYGSVIASAYNIATADGMNEKGLVANLLWLAESEFPVRDRMRPGLSISLWAQYVLDNFATVSEAVEALAQEPFALVSSYIPNMPDKFATLHLSLSDPTGDNAIFEYIGGRLVIHHDPSYRVMTNSPRYEYQLAVNDYWKEVGGLQMLPGTNRSSDRFVRASFYIHAIPQTADAAIAVPSVLSVMRNVSVPFGITTPDKPHISSTRWRSVANQKDKVYYFESTLTPNLFWLDLKKMDFSPQAKVKKLSLTNGEVYAGDAVKDLKDSPSFTFLFQTPVL